MDHKREDLTTTRVLMLLSGFVTIRALGGFSVGLNTKCSA